MPKNQTRTEAALSKMLDDIAREHFAIETRLYEDEDMPPAERARLEARQAELVAGYSRR